MTEQELENRIEYLEALISKANHKDLPYLNQTYQKLMDKLVALDMSKTETNLHESNKNG